jgi:crotonobetainyl-CoA:carnitine CoA-transferase CaiB-like acyl-CoA transferase
VGERLFDEHLQARENFVWVENPLLGNEPLYGQPIRLSKTPGTIRSAAPALGQHTREVLEELLGMQAAEIEALAADGVLQ